MSSASKLCGLQTHKFKGGATSVVPVMDDGVLDTVP